MFSFIFVIIVVVVVIFDYVRAGAGRIPCPGLNRLVQGWAENLEADGLLELADALEEGPASGSIVISQLGQVPRHTALVGHPKVTPHELHDLVGEEIDARAARVIAKALAEDRHQVS